MKTIEEQIREIVSELKKPNITEKKRKALEKKREKEAI